MNKKKDFLRQEIDTETLLSQLNESDVTNESNVPSAPDNMLDFVSFYNLKPGTNVVKGSLLYKLYTAWNKSEKLNKREFMNRLTVYLERSKSGHVLINIDNVALTNKAKEVFFKTKHTIYLNTPRFKKNIERWMKELDIIPGDYAVDGTVLHYIYRDWSINNRLTAISVTDFNQILTYYFKFYKEFDRRYPEIFYIDKNNLRVDGVTLEKAKEAAKTKELGKKRYKKSST